MGRGNISPKSVHSHRGNIRCKRSKSAKRSTNQVLYTPMSELRRNYETLLSMIQPSSAPQRDLPLKKEKLCNLDLSDLPSARYTLPSGYVDDLLNDLTINRSQGDSLLQEHQCNSNLDLSDLPSTRYTLPPGFVDKFLDELEVMDVTSK